MWNAVMIYPELNLERKKQDLVFADGLVRNTDIKVDQARTLHEAKLKALHLAKRTLKECGYNSPVIGYGVRSTLSRSKKKLHWQLLLPQLVARIKAWKQYARERGL